MSDTEKERSPLNGGDCGGSGGVGGGNDGDDEEDEKGDIGRRSTGRRNRNNQRGLTYRRNFSRVKQAVLYPFRKAKKEPRPGPSPPSSSSSFPSCDSVTANFIGKSINRCLCFTQPPTSESPLDSSGASDPNNPDLFTYECLKSLIEKNDIYSKDCNPHIDIVSSCSN